MYYEARFQDNKINVMRRCSIKVAALDMTIVSWNEVMCTNVYFLSVQFSEIIYSDEKSFKAAVDEFNEELRDWIHTTEEANWNYLTNVNDRTEKVVRLHVQYISLHAIIYVKLIIIMTLIKSDNFQNICFLLM